MQKPKKFHTWVRLALAIHSPGCWHLAGYLACKGGWLSL